MYALMLSILLCTTGLAVKEKAMFAWDFAASAAARDTIISGEVFDQQTLLDAVLDHYESAVIDHEFDVRLQNLWPIRGFDPPQYEVLFPHLVSIDAEGRATRLGDCWARVDVSWGNLIRQMQFMVKREMSVSYQFSHWAAGSLVAHMEAAVAERRDGQTPPDCLPLYTKTENGVYLPAAGCWLADLSGELNCLSTCLRFDGRDMMPSYGIPPTEWRQEYPANPLTLVSPRHCLCAGHFCPHPGWKARWYDTNPPYYAEREVVEVLNWLNVPNKGDLAVCVLDADLPETVSFAQVLPAAAEDQLPLLGQTLSYAQYMPSHSWPRAIWLNQYRQAGILRASLGGGHFMSWGDPDHEFCPGPIFGDSGSPIFFLIDDEPILINLMSAGYTRTRNAEVNESMAELGGGYQLTEIDLSSFNNYG